MSADKNKNVLVRRIPSKQARQKSLNNALNSKYKRPKTKIEREYTQTLDVDNTSQILATSVEQA